MKKNNQGQSFKEPISMESVYNGYWKCRDFELQHFWQRSVFLTAFLLACYAGYGGLIVSCTSEDHLPIPILNAIAFYISFVGILLSSLWIMMVKGSKAWYERWESAISAFVCNYQNEFEGEAAKIAAFNYENLKGYEKAEMSNWLWDTKAGAFSPSKVNVAIGHLSLAIWLVLSMVHITIAGEVGCWYFCRTVWVLTNPYVMLVVLVFGCLSFWLYSQTALKSSSL